MRELPDSGGTGFIFESSLRYLGRGSGYPFTSGTCAIAYNKIIIIDGTTVITGSFNFTKAAEVRNAENLLIIRSPELAKSYIRNWERHREHSEPYEPRD
ncbi:MAG: phospholipase D-like domain-containing protein [Desulfomonilaceae bacterium]